MICVNQRATKDIARECRDGRIAIIAGREHKELKPILQALKLDSPRWISNGPTVVLHLMPEQGIEKPPCFGLDPIGRFSPPPEIKHKLQPLSWQLPTSKPPEESQDPVSGGVTYWFSRHAYLEVFSHAGIIESVDCGSFFEKDEDGKTVLRLDDLFEECATAIERLLGILCETGVTSTIYAFLTLVHSAGITLSVKRPRQLKHLNGLSLKNQDCKAELDVWCDAALNVAYPRNVSLHLVSALSSCA